jgi:hypothetical protein
MQGTALGINELQPERVRALLVSPQERKMAELEQELTIDFEA